MKKSFWCKLGFHDWQAIGIGGLRKNPFFPFNEYIRDEVCIKCGEKDLRWTNYFTEQRLREEKALKIYRGEE